MTQLNVQTDEKLAQFMVALKRWPELDRKTLDYHSKQSDALAAKGSQHAAVHEAGAFLETLVQSMALAVKGEAPEQFRRAVDSHARLRVCRKYLFGLGYIDAEEFKLIENVSTSSGRRAVVPGPSTRGGVEWRGSSCGRRRTISSAATPPGAAWPSRRRSRHHRRRPSRSKLRRRDRVEFHPGRGRAVPRSLSALTCFTKRLVREAVCAPRQGRRFPGPALAGRRLLDLDDVVLCPSQGPKCPEWRA